jgi:hypothetical protein
VPVASATDRRSDAPAAPPSSRSRPLPITDLADRTHRRLLCVGVIVAVTLTGMVLLWPSAEALPESRPATTR